MYSHVQPIIMSKTDFLRIHCASPHTMLDVMLHENLAGVVASDTDCFEVSPADVGDVNKFNQPYIAG